VRKIIGHAQLVCNAARTGAVLQISTVRASGSGVRDACRPLPKIACASLVRCRGTRLRSARQLPRRLGNYAPSARGAVVDRKTRAGRCLRHWKNTWKGDSACSYARYSMEPWAQSCSLPGRSSPFRPPRRNARTAPTKEGAPGSCAQRPALQRAPTGGVKSQAAADPILHAGRGHAAGSRPAASRKAKAGDVLPGPAPATAEAIRDLLGNRAGGQPLPGFLFVQGRRPPAKKPLDRSHKTIQYRRKCRSDNPTCGASSAQ